MSKKLNLKGVSVSTWTRTALLIFSVVNMLLVRSGHSVLPFSEAELEQFISDSFVVIMSFINWWENNSFTDKAQEADKVLVKEKTK